MWNKIKQFLAAPVFADDEEKTHTAALLNPLLLSMFVASIFFALATVLVFAQKLGGGIAVLLVFTVVVVSKLLLQGGYVRAAGHLFVVGVGLPVLAIFLLSDQRSFSGMLLLSLTVVSGLVLGRRTALIVAILSSLFTLAALIAAQLGYALPVIFSSPQLSNWVVFTIALALTWLPLNLALRNLNEALSRARTYAVEADERGRRLESLVRERDVELSRRAAYLGATTAIAAEIAALERDPQVLFDQVVKIITRQFGFYHTGLFLLDDDGQWAVLQAASSEGGQRMIQRGHQLRVGVQGIVGMVAALGQARIAQDVGVDAVFFDNPDLPETHSEVALPLRVRDRIIGVLDVQSVERGAFSEQDVTVLQALADQIAVAVTSIRMLNRVETSVAADRHAYDELTWQAWQELLRTRVDLAFAADERGVMPFTEWEPQMKAAVQSGQVVGEGDVLAIPIRVRNQVMGVIDGRKADGKPWTQAEIDLLQALTEQLNVALESAQLYESTRRRAAREQLAREITDRMRAALDWDELMQTTLQEIARAVGAARTFVQWIPEEQSQ